MRVVHIEAKRREAEEDAATLEVALAGHVGRDLTPADASVLSGLPLDAAEAGLIALARRFPSRIRASPEGALVFRFTSLKRPRPGIAKRAFAVLVKRFVEPVLAV